MKQKTDFDRHHKARLLPELPIGQSVWISDLRQRRKVEKVHGSPRSYIIRSPIGVFRRNKKFVHPLLDTSDDIEVNVPDLKQDDLSEKLLASPAPLSPAATEKSPPRLRTTPQVDPVPLRRIQRNIRPPLRLDI